MNSLPHDPPLSVEFGSTCVVEIKRSTRQGTLRPLLCICEDGGQYVVKPYSTGGAWPQCAEWICARLGRAIGLNIPNYRQAFVSEELADAWNATGGRHVEAGPGFASLFVKGADECEVSAFGDIPAEERTAILAFDWWIRNSDRRRHNPNLLWSHAESRGYLIDHEKAGHTETAEAFWQDHLFAQHRPWMTPALRDRMQNALKLIPAIKAELPSAWTTATSGLDWFFDHLRTSIADEPQQSWRPYE